MPKENKLPETLEDLNVKYFKLMNGHSIVAYVHAIEGDYSIGLEEPMKVTVDPRDQSYLLSPYMPFSKGNVHILDTMNILLQSDVTTDIKARYMKLILQDKLDLDPGFDDPDSKSVH